MFRRKHLRRSYSSRYSSVVQTIVFALGHSLTTQLQHSIIIRKIFYFNWHPFTILLERETRKTDIKEDCKNIIVPLKHTRTSLPSELFSTQDYIYSFPGRLLAFSLYNKATIFNSIQQGLTFFSRITDQNWAAALKRATRA